MQTYVFITSNWFSGSTLFSLLLDLHPRAFTLGELYNCYPSKIRHCSCGSFITDCDFWSQYHKKLSAAAGAPIDFQFRLRPEFSNKYWHKLVSLSMNRLKIPLPPKFWVPDVGPVNQNHDIYFDAFEKANDHDCFVDTTKEWIYLYCLKSLHGNRRNIKVIHLTRSVFGYVASLKKRFKRIEGRECKLNDIGNIVRGWLFNERKIGLATKEYDPQSVINVNYEDLCRTPDEVLAKVYRQIGLSEFHFTGKVSSKQKCIIGNQGLYLKNAGKIKEDRRWKEILTPPEITRIENTLARMNYAIPAS